MEAERTGRRSLRYIRLAAFLAECADADRIILTVREIEEIVGDTLPHNARFPSWWRNDRRKMHSRAWLTAGWKVGQMAPGRSEVEFLRVKT